MIKKIFLWIQSSKKNIFLATILPPLVSLMIYFPLKLYDDKQRKDSKILLDLDEISEVSEDAVYVNLKGKIQYRPYGYYIVDEKEKGRLFSYYIPITSKKWKEGDALKFFIFRKIKQDKERYTTKDPVPYLGDSDQDTYAGRLVKKNVPNELKNYILSQGNKIAETTYILESTSWSDRFIAIPACTILVCFLLLCYSYAEKEKHKDLEKRKTSLATTQGSIEFKASNNYFYIALALFVLFSVPAIILSAPFLSPLFRVSFLNRLYLHIRDPQEFLIFMGICFAIGAAGLILYYIRFDMIKVVLRPDRGIEICRRSGNRFIAWDDIECMTSVVFQVQSRGMYAFTSEKHEVTLKDQSKVSLTSGIEDVFRIAQAIDVELMKRLYPEYLEKFQKGLPVSFGSLTLTSEGFSKGNSTLPWESVAFVGIDNGYLVVEARGKILSWYKKGCGKIPHVPILLRLVKTKVNF